MMQGKTKSRKKEVHMELQEFFSMAISNPLLAMAILLTLGVILVNGWTDAPNAIATCVSTRGMSERAAVLMAAVFNFLGVFVMTKVNATVAETITKMVDFGENKEEAIIALSAAMFAIVLWATLAWWFGIPTSESHALIAGLTGSAIALHGNLNGVNGGEWMKVIYGIGVSIFFGFVFGWLICKLVTLICQNMERRKTQGFFRGAQITGAASMAFMRIRPASCGKAAAMCPRLSRRSTRRTSGMGRSSTRWASLRSR